MFGLWPSCAYNGCRMPAVFQIRNEREGQELLVDLCILHLTTVPKAVSEMDGLRQKDQDLLRYGEEEHDQKV